MPTNSEIKNSNSISGSSRYDLYGKGGHYHGLKNNTEQWLKQNNILQPKQFKGTRVFATSGSDGLDGFTFEETMSMVNGAYKRKNNSKNVALSGVISFDHDELSPKNPLDWERAVNFSKQVLNRFEKKYSDQYRHEKKVNFPFMIVAHVDGKHHYLHCHWLMNKTNTLDGKKLNTKWGQTTQLIRQATDEISQDPEWADRMRVIPKPKIAMNSNERSMVSRGVYVRNNDYRLALDKAIANPKNHSLTDLINDINHAGRFKLHYRSNKTKSNLVIEFARGRDATGTKAVKGKRLNSLSSEKHEYYVDHLKKQMKLPAAQREATERLQDWRDLYDRYPRIIISTETIQQLAARVRGISQSLSKTSSAVQHTEQTMRTANHNHEEAVRSADLAPLPHAVHQGSASSISRSGRSQLSGSSQRQVVNEKQYKTLIQLQFAAVMLDPDVGQQSDPIANGLTLVNAMDSNHLGFTRNAPGQKIAVHYFHSEDERHNKSNAVTIPLTQEDVDQELDKAPQNRIKSKQLAQQCLQELKSQGLELQLANNQTNKAKRHTAAPQAPLVPTLQQVLAKADYERRQRSIREAEQEYELREWKKKFQKEMHRLDEDKLSDKQKKALQKQYEEYLRENGLDMDR